MIKEDEGSIKIPLPQTYSGLAVPIRSAIEHMVNAGKDSASEVLFKTLGGLSPIDFSTGGINFQSYPNGTSANN